MQGFSEIITTGDGSKTLYNPTLNEYYHSKHGALQEAMHVFIRAGLDFFNRNRSDNTPIKILEIGLGTGLNALLSLKYAEEHHVTIYYTGIEPFPISKEQLKDVEYPDIDSLNKYSDFWKLMHQKSCSDYEAIGSRFYLKKITKPVLEATIAETYDLIYYDAFGPRAQPEMWEKAIFEKLYKRHAAGGIFTTYCVTGNLRRTLKDLGYSVEKIPGPPGKREMTRATKP
ncbi:MAG: tRNA (5-methylaminomethyl-2-thiouridine)(34)-methyltransferase MnmD [Flavobacteriaceae bacterium]|nr:tRNA (5-methylaminomethyl-2-thiouridine)(34)-methyltransferase MnmD [Flavobacteriaceae bacterium]